MLKSQDDYQTLEQLSKRKIVFLLICTMTVLLIAVVVQLSSDTDFSKPIANYTQLYATLVVVVFYALGAFCSAIAGYMSAVRYSITRNQLVGGNDAIDCICLAWMSICCGIFCYSAVIVAVKSIVIYLLAKY
jgi:hypothetical protein